LDTSSTTANQNLNKEEWLKSPLAARFAKRKGDLKKINQ
jgi:hypothetical protein